MNVALLLSTRPNLLLFGMVAERKVDFESRMPEPKQITASGSSGSGRLPDDDESEGWNISNISGSDSSSSSSTAAHRY